jgi:hypothetical protein
VLVPFCHLLAFLIANLILCVFVCEQIQVHNLSDMSAVHSIVFDGLASVFAGVRGWDEDEPQTLPFHRYTADVLLLFSHTHCCW